ncbi:MAG: TraB/VirB10 family protein [Thermocrinis sp.]|jgi:conjugal transfer pilus assembly protein TraB|uniref:TraB/VirB10 family protein n=1 Tax=Thermocrinis sp. TaxID=2024383 RepID=UPI003BFDB8B5
MGFLDKLRKKQQQEQEYEEVPIEEEEVQEERKRSFLGGDAIKWGGIFVGAAAALFLLSRLFSSGNDVVIKSDPELQRRLLEEALKSQAQMNEQILNQLREMNEELKRLKESRDVKTGEKKTDSGSVFKIEESPPSSPPPPPPPSTPFYTEPLKPPEEYKPKINRVERKEEQSRADGNLLAQSGISDVPPVANPEKPAQEKKTVYLPAGATLKGRIINSFPAPVGGERFPAVLIELEGHARLPNNYRLDLSRCLVIAKAEGSYVLERAKLETYKLSCILKNGKVIEVSPKGMVISGEDGLEGVRGKFLNVNREQLLTYFGGTTLSGFFSALQQGQITRFSTPFGTTTDIKNEFLYALYGSLAQTWNEFAKFYLEQAKKIVPVVVVQAGIPVYIVLVDGVSLEVSVDEIRKGL